MAGLGDVFKFFSAEDYPLSKFRAEWAELSPESKAQIRDGIENGSLTY